MCVCVCEYIERGGERKARDRKRDEDTDKMRKIKMKRLTKIDRKILPI